MNIFLYELKAYRKTAILWTISLSALAAFFLALYPAFSNDVAATRKLLENLPEAVRKIFGLSLESFFTLLGFYSYMFLYVLLSGSILAMNLGTGILSKEMREKTADFLLTKPVSRHRIVTAKLLAAAVTLVIIDAVFIAFAALVAAIVSHDAFSMKLFLMISVTLFFVQVIFMALGIFIAAASSKIRSVLPISLSTVFGFFILNMLDAVIGERAMRYIVPFRYFDNAYILKNASYEVSFILVELILVAVLLSASYVIYIKKDIHSV